MVPFAVEAFHLLKRCEYIIQDSEPVCNNNLKICLEATGADELPRCWVKGRAHKEPFPVSVVPAVKVVLCDCLVCLALPPHPLRVHERDELGG